MSVQKRLFANYVANFLIFYIFAPDFMTVNKKVNNHKLLNKTKY